MENKHGIGACGREQSLPLIERRQAKGREIREEMPYRMWIERGNDSGAAFRARPLYRAPGHCLVSEMKPIEIAKPDNGATQMRRYCRAAVKPLHRAADRQFHMTGQSMRRRVTKLYAGRPPSAGKSSRPVSCHAVGTKDSRNVSPGGVA